MPKFAEYPLWVFEHYPIPRAPAVAFALGPEAPQQGLPYTRTYMLGKLESGEVKLYRANEEEETRWRLPIAALQNSYQRRFSFAFVPWGVVTAVQKGSSAYSGTGRSEPPEISFHFNDGTVATLFGYDPQVVYTGVLWQHEGNLECIQNLAAVLLFYMGTDGKTLRVYAWDSFLFQQISIPEFTYTFPQPRQLVAAVPIQGSIQLWFVTPEGTWEGLKVTPQILRPRLSGQANGPVLWNNPQDGSHAVVFGAVWDWWVDKAQNRFVFRKGSELREVPAGMSLQNVCFTSVAFDHAGYPTIAFQDGRGTIFVRYWDLARRQYVTTPSISGQFPFLYQESDVPAFRYPPASNVVLIYLKNGSLVRREQKDAYGIEYPVPALKHDVPAKVEVLPLRVRLVSVDDEVLWRSSLYPYYTLPYLNSIAPEYIDPIGHAVRVRLIDAEASIYDIVKSYATEVRLGAGIQEAELSIRDLVKSYSASVPINVALNAVDFELRTVARIVSLTAETTPTLTASVADANAETRTVMTPITLPTINLGVNLVDATVSLG